MAFPWLSVCRLRSCACPGTRFALTDTIGLCLPAVAGLPGVADLSAVPGLRTLLSAVAGLSHEKVSREMEMESLIKSVNSSLSLSDFLTGRSATVDSTCLISTGAAS